MAETHYTAPGLWYNEGMKTLLIVILALALALGAFLSRPSEASFKEMINSKRSPGEKVLSVLLGDSYQYKDRYLWTAVQKDGKTVYLGVFSQWFRVGEKPAQESAPASQS